MSNILYKGKALIKILRGNKVIKMIKQKNQGTDRFFHAIMRAIIGSSDDISSTMPNYIDIGAYSGDNDFISCLSNRIYIPSKYIKNGEIYFSVAIPSTSIDKSLTEITTLRLYESSNAQIHLAEINLDNEKKININDISGMSLYIEWTMNFLNVEEGNI